MNFIEIADRYKKHFKDVPRIFAAPGRVNLIGEHTDYNDGFVFPMAIPNYTVVAMTPRQDRMLWLWSENMQELKTIDLDENSRGRGHWSDYVAGIANILEKNNIELTGANLYIESDVPVGAGLSSSAALEISSALALLNSVDQSMDSADLAKLGQRAENEFVGMNCGIMDQFISVHAERDRALFLDCRTLDYQNVPLPSDKVRVVICNTMIKHELGASEYNKRRTECEAGVKIFNAALGNVKALRDVSVEQFEQYQGQLPEVVKMRCKHVITENDRTSASVTALESHDISQFGKLMNESHDSLRDDYQVSCKELDIMVNIARKQPGVYGARMTGGGFGGCTVNLVSSSQVGHFCENIYRDYEKMTTITPQIYIATPARGAFELK